MNKFPFGLIVMALIAIVTFTGCSNPSVDAGKVGYVTNEPIFIGEKGEFLDIIIGPSSYGLGWCNKIKYEDTYKPFTIKEYFSEAADSSEGAQKDTRILSSDDINMEVSVSVVLCIRNSPATKNFDEDSFKKNARAYFEHWLNFWPDRMKEPFRSETRDALRNETYSSARKQRAQLSKNIRTWLETQLAQSPLEVLAVNISNINPPARMQAEQELLKATEIATDRQKQEKKLQDEKKDVLQQEAKNLRAALDIAPEFLRWRELTIKERYVEGFNNLITGDAAKSIDKTIFVPYGTPIAATPEGK